MKKIIKGSLFNTDTAKFLGCIEPAGYNTNNFNYFCETLYRTKSGKYFLHGEGHGNSKYGKWHGNIGGWGEQIIPLTYNMARQWARDNLTDDEYIEAFIGTEIKSNIKIPLNISVSPRFKHHLNLLKERTGKSISQILEEKFYTEKYWY